MFPGPYLGGIYLISSLKKTEIVSHRVPKLPTLITRTPPINNDYDVLVVGGQDRVPISVETDVDMLCAGPVVPVSELWVMIMNPSALPLLVERAGM